MWSSRILHNRECGLALKAQAVLFRTSHHSGPLEVELTRRNIPFVKFGGLKFLEAAHIKDVLAFLRFAENMRDRVAGFRALQLLPGVGPATAGARARCARRAAPIPAPALACTSTPPAAARDDWPDFVDMLQLVRGARRRLAGRTRSRVPLVRAAPAAPPRGRGHAPGRSRAARADRAEPIRAASAFSPN